MYPTVALALASLLCGQSPDMGSVLFPSNRFLVHAWAVEVKRRPKDDPRGYGESGIFTIDRVYVGSDRLKGKQFRVDVPSGVFTMRNIDAAKKSWLKQGEEGLWWIAADSDGKTFSDLPILEGLSCSYPLRLYAPGFPYRDPKRFPRNDRMTDDAWAAWVADSSAYYQSGVRWAEAIEKVYQAKSDVEGMELLKNYAAAKNSPIAAWAIHSLAKLKPAELKLLLPGLAENDELSIWSQTVLDKELCRIEGPRWQQSRHRRTMLQRWISRDIPDPGQYPEGISRIVSALRDRELDHSTFIRVFKAGMEGKGKLSKEQLSEFTALLEEIHPREDRDKRLLFDYLTELVLSPDAEIRKHAARGLWHTAPFDRSQLNTLRKLAESTKDADVKRVLDRLPDPPSFPEPLPERRNTAPSLPSSEHK